MRSIAQISDACQLNGHNTCLFIYETLFARNGKQIQTQFIVALTVDIDL